MRLRRRHLAVFVLLLAIAGCAAQKPRQREPHSHGLFGPVIVKTPAKTRIYELHGHVGPYVVLGYRAGLLGRRLLDSPGYFDLSARVECPLAPPPSCFIDGVQLGAGCTVGKRNLTVAAAAACRVLFTSEKRRRSVAIALAPGVPARIKERIGAIGVERTGALFFELPEAELFVIERRPATPASRPGR